MSEHDPHSVLPHRSGVGSTEVPLDSMTIGGQVVRDRSLFHAILNLEEFPGCVHDARERANGFLQNAGASGLERFDQIDLCSVASLKRLQEQLRTEMLASVSRSAVQAAIADSELHFRLKQYAPAALIDGFCLHAAAGAVSAHTPVGALLHKIQLDEIEQGACPQGYLAMARSIDVYFHRIASFEFCADSELLQSSLHVALFEMVLSLFHRDNLPELLGLVLCKKMIATPPVIAELQAHIRGRGGATRFFLRENLPIESHDTALTAVMRAIDEYLKRWISDSPEARSIRSTQENRIWLGFAAYWEILSKWNRLVASICDERRLKATSEMRELIRRKAPHAQGYHRRMMMEGQPFDPLMATSDDRFLRALSKSRYIRPGRAHESPLLRRSVKFGGPMFGVFSAAEIQTIARWIDQLSPDDQCEMKESIFDGELTSLPNSAEGIRSTLQAYQIRNIDPRYARASLQDLYYYFLNIDRYMDILPLCREVVTKYLDEASGTIQVATLIEDYDPEALRDWLYAQHRRQVSSYVPLDKRPKQPREALIKAFTAQFHVAMLDGAWLHKSGSPTLSHSDIGLILRKIYSDEIGCGDIRVNHANVFRSLMEEMGVDLPEFDTWEFAHLQVLSELGFKISVFILCLSQCTERFLPELLGYNLAQELTGVGDGFPQTGDVLREYGFSSRYFDIHNTIDNVDTGHSGLAIEAILRYMDSAATVDNNLQQQLWARIRLGYHRFHSFTVAQ